MRNKAILAAGLIWIGLLGVGFAILGHEEYQAAPQSITENSFPIATDLTLDPHRPTLLLFAHPKCPCTEATLANLDQIRGQTRDALAVTIIFTLPPNVPLGWEKGALWTEASKMKGIHMFLDINGIETRRFGVTTSGHVLLYSPEGRLLFSGGITASRGHAGDNPGGLAIVRLTLGHAIADKVEKPVFGCTLL